MQNGCLERPSDLAEGTWGGSGRGGDCPKPSLLSAPEYKGARHRGQARLPALLLLPSTRLSHKAGEMPPPRQSPSNRQSPSLQSHPPLPVPPSSATLQTGLRTLIRAFPAGPQQEHLPGLASPGPVGTCRLPCRFIAAGCGERVRLARAHLADTAGRRTLLSSSWVVGERSRAAQEVDG